MTPLPEFPPRFRKTKHRSHRHMALRVCNPFSLSYLLLFLSYFLFAFEHKQKGNIDSQKMHILRKLSLVPLTQFGLGKYYFWK